jgi:hypothetical protein
MPPTSVGNYRNGANRTTLELTLKLTTREGNLLSRHVSEISGLTAATIIKKIQKKQLKARRVRSYAIEAEELRKFLSREPSQGRLKD